MKHADAFAQIKKIREMAESYMASDYRCVRLPDGLIIRYANGKEIYVPRVKFRPYQKEVQTELFINKKKRFFLVRPRRSGKEVESWNLLVQAAIETPGLYLMIYPTNVRARMVLWEGAIVLPDNSSMKFLDMVPKEFVQKRVNDEMVLKLTNGSIIWVLGSDIDPDKLRGTNPRGVVCSEYAYSDPRVYYVLMPILRQNGGWIILQTTFNGMNHAWRYMNEIKSNPDWYCRVDSVESLVDEQGNRYVTDDMIKEDRLSGMPEFMIQQEYYSVVELNQETLYFAHQINALYAIDSISDGMIIPGKRVRAHFDIGWNDSTFVVLEQMNKNGDPHIIGNIENSNKTFEFYIQEAEKFCIQRGLYLDRNLFLPHDGANTNWNTGKNSVAHAMEMGYTAHVMEKPKSHPWAIQSMRKMLYRTKIDKTLASRFIDCMSNYSKEFDSKSGVYKDHPKHDWTSHGVKAFQTMTFAYEKGLVNENTFDVIYYNQ